ncbi:MAG: arylsulfatase [Myxococcaceae bacterium]
MAKKKSSKATGNGGTRVDRELYPAPDYAFPNAKIGLTYETSKPDFPKPTTAPEGAPNILLVLLDDVGYGWLETFGGMIKSPSLERLAKNGLRYCQFHTTALCSPTRAALLTGRNHHTVSTGVIQELGTGYPGYSGMIPRSCATIAKLLSENGYSTGWWGKNHNVPDNQTSPAGPFERWPTQMGFDYFYGFIGGETDQFYPALYRGTSSVSASKSPEEGYHLTRDLADDCIAWMRQQKSIAPNRPFFAYFATGAAHAPHQPPLDWRGRNKGRFDMGWDKCREAVWKRQLDLGVIPRGTKLTARPKEIPAWDAHSDDQKRLFTRFAENYADFLEHTDHEVGRLMDAIDRMGELENTLVLYVTGDNGSSAEGTLTGTLNEMAALNGFEPSMDEVLPRVDEIGLPGTCPHYPVGWAWAGDTPFQWTKQIASHFGGTRNGLVVSWPKTITDHGGLRFQFHHVIDIAPTILEVVGIKEPTMVNGIGQRPIEGVSMGYSFSEKNADAPSRRSTQYFEIFGNRALYSEGWIASCRHGRLPWKSAGHVRFQDDRWELYNIAEDFSQSEDLAAKHPEKLRELQDLFMAEAGRYNVLPLDDRVAERMDVTLRPSFFTGRDKVTFYPGMVRLPEGSAPKTHNVSHVITVGAEIPGSGADGVLVCLGGDSSGWSLFIRDGRLVYHYNWFDMARYEVVSTEPVPKGRVELTVDFTNESAVPGGPATVKLFIGGRDVGSGRIEKQVRGRFGTEGLDVGVDTLSPVAKNYPRSDGFAFTGRIEHVTFEFEGPGRELGFEERAELHAGME